MNRWNIPDWLENEVKDRDRHCVYCRVEFGSPKETRESIATWEHIVNDARIVNRENIARCCVACNSSKGTKKLSDWLAPWCWAKRIQDKVSLAGLAMKKQRLANASMSASLFCFNFRLTPWEGCQQYQVIYRIEHDRVFVDVVSVTAHDYRKK